MNKILTLVAVAGLAVGLAACSTNPKDTVAASSADAEAALTESTVQGTLFIDSNVLTRTGTQEGSNYMEVGLSGMFALQSSQFGSVGISGTGAFAADPKNTTFAGFEMTFEIHDTFVPGSTTKSFDKDGNQIGETTTEGGVSKRAFVTKVTIEDFGGEITSVLNAQVELATKYFDQISAMEETERVVFLRALQRDEELGKAGYSVLTKLIDVAGVTVPGMFP